jgi:hypothetical protein
MAATAGMQAADLILLRLKPIFNPSGLRYGIGNRIKHMDRNDTQRNHQGMVASAFQGGMSMDLVFRIGTTTARKASFGVAAATWLLMISTVPVLAQTDDQAMDQDQPAQISCDDGTDLTGVFSDTGVEITMADGTKVTLAQKDDDKGFRFTDGNFTLSGDDSSASWTVGKKAPVPCHIDDAQKPTHFDEPLTVDNAPLPKDKANPDAQPQVNCYRFAGFMVKEVDLGEKGAASLAIAKPDAACEKTGGKDEKPIKDDVAGYFFGAKGNLAFFQADDSYNGGLPFVVYDTKTMKKLFDDSLEGNDFDALDVNGTVVKITYRRVYSADCSLYKDGGDCAAKLKQATGLGTPDAALPDCGAAYDAEKKRTPDYAKEIEDLPSVISYDAELDFDGTAVTIKPLKGETSCSVPT